MDVKDLRETVSIIVHLAFWSQLGVLTRIYIGILFSNACTGAWGVCLTSAGMHQNSLGAYFVDLPANMLGCFIMGLTAASATLNLPRSKGIALLPAHSVLQAVPELHTGIRTGYCGTLTTFASWEFALIGGLVGGNGRAGGQWAELIWGLIIGMQLCLSSYVFGEYCALLVDRYMDAGGRKETDLEGIVSREMEDIAKERHSQLARPEYALERDEFNASEGVQMTNNYSWDINQFQQSHEQPERLAISSDAEPTSMGQTAVTSQQETDMRQDGHGIPLKEDSNPTRASDMEAEKEKLNPLIQQNPHLRHWQIAVNAGAMVLLSAVTALFISFLILDTNPAFASRQAQWFAVVLAPFGCTLRYFLSKFNYSLPGCWQWFPAGTFCANMIACFIDFVAAGVSSRISSLNGWSLIVLYAVPVGFSGGLSTVSTFVAEVHMQLGLVPEKLYGFIYSVGSLLAAALLGVIIYGSFVWK